MRIIPIEVGLVIGVSFMVQGAVRSSEVRCQKSKAKSYTSGQEIRTRLSIRPKAECSLIGIHPRISREGKLLDDGDFAPLLRLAGAQEKCSGLLKARGYE